MPWNPKKNVGTVTSCQGVTTRDRGRLWRLIKGVPSRQGGWRVVKGCRVVTKSDLDESSRGDDSLQRVTLTSCEGYAESSRRVTSRQGLPSHYREWPWWVVKGWQLVTESDFDESWRVCRVVNKGWRVVKGCWVITDSDLDESWRGDDSWPPSLPPTWTLQASLSQLLWITLIPWHSKVKITSYHLCN